MTAALVLVDLQRIFAEPGSPWAAPEFERAAAGCRALLAEWDGPVVLTRFLPPQRPTGAWVDYYRDWPFALDPASAPLYALVDGFDLPGAVPVDRTTFGKWDDRTAAALPGVDELVVGGVSTDCCVLSTVLAAADAGLRVQVVAAACAGASEADHRRALDAMALYTPLVTVR